MSTPVASHPFQEAVAEFHRLCGLTVGQRPGLPDRELRASLVAEETREVAEALEAAELVQVVAELCDLYYVVYGSAVTFGLVLAAPPGAEPAPTIGLPDHLAWAERLQRLGLSAAEEIQRAELSQVQVALEDLIAAIDACFAALGLQPALFFLAIHAANMAKAGGPRRADGKILKPAGWQPADIAGLLLQVTTMHPYRLGT